MAAPQRSDAARNRAALLDAARRTRDARGFPAPLAEVAAEAGVGVGTAYRNFPTHRALVEALALESLDGRLAAAREADADSRPDALDDLLVAAIRMLAEDPSLATVVSDPDGSGPELREALTGLLEVFGRLLARAQDAGLVRTDLGRADVHHLVCGVQLSVRLAGTADAVDRYGRVLLTGLRP